MLHTADFGLGKTLLRYLCNITSVDKPWMVTVFTKGRPFASTKCFNIDVIVFPIGGAVESHCQSGVPAADSDRRKR